MAQIRRQSIISTLVIFVGFFIGFIINLLFTNKQWFSIAQYGVTQSFNSFGQLIFATCSFGLTAYIYKFSPYYKAHCKPKENDMLAWALLLPTIGFLIFCIFGFFLKSFFIQKFGGKSPELVAYYFWLFPYGYFLLIYSILETYLWTLQKSIVSNFLREVVIRLYVLTIVLLFVFKIITFHQFLMLFVFAFGVLCLAAFLYLKYINKLAITFNRSRVTRKFFNKILIFTSFVAAGLVISTIASLIDSFTISSFIGQAGLGIFSIMLYMNNVIQVPQRSIVAVSIPILAEAWRNKDLKYIETIYKRSSINLLLVSLILFGCIWLCFNDIIPTLGMKQEFLTGRWVFFFLGLKTVVDLGTGVNGQIIGTSNYWRFEFLTYVILLILILPLNYYLIKTMGIKGAAISALIAYAIYNAIRLYFLWIKFRLQPFSVNSLYSILLAVGFYFITILLTSSLSGWPALICKGGLFAGLMCTAIAYFNLTPDAKPILTTLRNRLNKLIGKNNI